MLLVYLGLAILVYIQFGAGENPKRNRTLCFCIGAFLFLISAMKPITYRGDLIAYAARFESLRYLSYGKVLEMWMDETLKDGIFYMVAKVFGDLGMSAEVWMGFIALVFAVGISWFIYRNSAKPFLSLMLLMTLGYYQFTLSALRQTVALAIIFMLSYQYMFDRRPIKFLISVIIAALFHSSAILFLPAYIVAGWKIGWKQIALVSGVAAIYFLFPNVVRWALEKIAWNESVASYAARTKALTWSGFIIHSCILFYCFLFRNETVLDPYHKWRRVDVFINCMIVGLCLQMLSTMIAEAFRMAYYYNMCCIAVVPNLVVENKRKSNHSTMYILLSICLVAYMIWNEAFFDLVFFWQV